MDRDYLIALANILYSAKDPYIKIDANTAHEIADKLREIAGRMILQ